MQRGTRNPPMGFNAERELRPQVNCAWRPPRKIQGDGFPVAVGALVGACFPPGTGWCRHDDTHFLRTLWTKQGASEECLVRHMMLRGHDEFLPVGQNVANDRDRSDGRAASVYNCSLARAFERQISGTRVPPKASARSSE